jgi:hypothetical protein
MLVFDTARKQLGLHFDYTVQVTDVEWTLLVQPDLDVALGGRSNPGFLGAVNSFRHDRWQNLAQAPKLSVGNSAVVAHIDEGQRSRPPLRGIGNIMCRSSGLYGAAGESRPRTGADQDRARTRRQTGTALSGALEYQ